MNMPLVDRSKIMGLTSEEIDIFNIIVKKDNTIRASKPKLDKNNPLTGRAAYVWRMVCFFVSPKGPHHCMPVCAPFDLADEDWKNRNEVTKELDKLVDKIIDAVDKNNWHGIRRWGKALGY